MKTLNRIIHKVYCEPWLIKPSVHYSFQEQLRHILANGNIYAEDDLLESEVPSYNIPTIGVIPVFGVLGKHLSSIEILCGGCSLDSIQSQLKTLAADPAVTTIALYVNSPGGQVTGTPETGDLIAKINAEVKPVKAYCDADCCSGALWLASCAGEFFVAASSNIGSCGVYSLYMDKTRALELEGIKIDAISAGKYKLMGASFKSLSDEERAIIQADVNATHEQFKSVLTAKRNILEADKSLEGMVYNGDKAVSIGMADGVIPTFDEFISFISN